MTRNTNMQTGNTKQANQQQGGKNAPSQTQDPNKIKDPNREAQKSNDQNYPGRTTGQSGDDADRNQSGQAGTSKPR
jgi:hypothetical protein